MFEDFVGQVIAERTDHYSCYNCQRVREYGYKVGFFCSGIVEKTTNGNPHFDVIRVCTNTSHDPDTTTVEDFSPDEALAMADVLTSTVWKWMYESKKYQEFREMG